MATISSVESRRRSRPAGVEAANGTLMAAQVAGFVVLILAVASVAVVGPVPALLAVGGLAVLALGARWPEYLLALGCAATLAGGTFAYLTTWGGLLLLGGGTVSAVGLLLGRERPRWRRIALPLLILAWLALRVALEQGYSVVEAAVICAAALVIALDCVHRRRDVVKAMSLAGSVFILSSLVVGVVDPGGRFEGISGNPNRLVFGLLIFLPFLCSRVLTRRRLLSSAPPLVLAAIAVGLILWSGSAQGVVGLVLLALIGFVCVAARVPTWTRTAAIGAGFVTAALLAGPALRDVQASEDLATLSGRTPIYEAALKAIMRHPVAGSGEQHFSFADVFDRSAHSVPLALALTGGVVLGLAWVLVLVILIVTVWRLARAGNILAAAPAALIAAQFVQTVQLVPLTWAVVGLFLFLTDGADLTGGSRSTLGPVALERLGGRR